MPGRADSIRSPGGQHVAMRHEPALAGSGVVSLSRGGAGELGAVQVDERVGELPLQADELDPVRLELAAANAALPHCLGG